MFEKLLVQLGEGVCVFSYKKANGEIRRAVGTVNPSLIPEISPLLSKIDIQAMYEESVDTTKADLSVYKGCMEKVGSLLSNGKNTYTPSDEYQNYYDFEAKGFRKFKKELLVDIIG